MSAQPFPFNEYRVEGDTAILTLRAVKGARRGEVLGETRIDAADLPALIEDGRPWYLHSAGYVSRVEQHDGKPVTIMLHRWLLQPPKDQVVDHMNRDKLDNRRANLRICTHAENLLNAGAQCDNALGIKNVHFDARRRHPYVVMLKRSHRIVMRCYCRTRNVARITASLARREHYGADYQ